MSLLTKLFSNTLAVKAIIHKLETTDNALFMRIVRWRKRRWAPRAPSKLYIVREPTPVDPVEAAELMQKYNNYNTSMRAIRKFLKEQHQSRTQKLSDESVYEEEAKVLASLLEENACWNRNTAKLREAREATEAKQKEAEMLAVMTDIEEQERARKDRANIIIQSQMEAAKNFVTMENLESEIEKALDNPLNYNFVLDSKGSTYKEESDGSLRLITEESEEADENSAQAH